MNKPTDIEEIVDDADEELLKLIVFGSDQERKRILKKKANKMTESVWKDKSFVAVMLLLLLIGIMQISIIILSLPQHVNVVVPP